MSADRDQVQAAEGPVSGDEMTTRAAELPGAVGADDLFAFGEEIDQFAGHAIKPPVARGAGRPPGSPNRATTAIRNLLLARGYRDPAEFLAALMSADARQLAADLGGKPVKVVTFAEAAAVVSHQVRAAVDLMPYFHQALPKQVEARIEQVRHLMLISEGGFANAQSDQGVIDVTPQASHGQASHDAAKTHASTGFEEDQAHD